LAKNEYSAAQNQRLKQAILCEETSLHIHTLRENVTRGKGRSGAISKNIQTTQTAASGTESLVNKLS